MGFHGSHNTNLTPTGLAHKLVGEIMFLADMLLDLDLQKTVKGYCDVILQNRSAISDATNLLPLEAALIILLAVERQHSHQMVDDLDNEINQRVNKANDEITELRSQLASLKKLLDDKT